MTSVLKSEEHLQVELFAAAATPGAKVALAVDGVIESDLLSLTAIHDGENWQTLRALLDEDARDRLELVVLDGAAVVHSIIVNGVPVDPKRAFAGDGRAVAGGYELTAQGSVAWGGSTSSGDDLFGFDSFANITGLLSLNGSARRDGDRLRLTADAHDEVGSAFHTQSLPIDGDTSFRTSFGFQIDGTQGSAGGDGLAFVLQSSAAGAGALGDDGGSIGLGARFSESVAVVFDTFENWYDRSANQVSVVLDGDVRTPLARAEVRDIDFNGGPARYAWIDYEGGTNRLDVYLSAAATKPATPLLSTVVDLDAELGERVHAGFTGATGGGARAAHDILDWNFATDEVAGTANGAYDMDLDASIPVELVVSTRLDRNYTVLPVIDVFVGDQLIGDDIRITATGDDRQRLNLEVPVDVDLNSLVIRQVNEGGKRVTVLHDLMVDDRVFALDEAIVSTDDQYWYGDAENMWLTRNDDYTFDLRPTPGHRLELYVGGRQWGGDAPRFDLTIDGSRIATNTPAWADARAGEFSHYVFEVPTGIDLAEASLTYVNDAYGGSVATDRDLVVQAVGLDGRFFDGAEALRADQATIERADGIAMVKRDGDYALKLPFIQPERALDYNRVTETHELILFDDFDGDQLNADNHGRALWSMTGTQWETRNRDSLTINPQMVTSANEPVGLDPFRVQDGALHITTSPIPDAAQSRLYDHFAHFGDGIPASDLDHANKRIDYSHYSGWLTTAQTWTQETGYFEIRARMAEGIANYNNFWLMPISRDWPTEIDIAEVPGLYDGRYLSVYHFDNYYSPTGVKIDPDFIETHNSEILKTNWDSDWISDVRADAFPGVSDPSASRYAAINVNNVQNPILKAALGYAQEKEFDLFEDFFVYSALWTDNEIRFYFGTDSHNQVEIFRAPTSPELNQAMYTIISHIGPDQGRLDKDAPGYWETINDATEVDYVKIFAPKAATSVVEAAVGEVRVDGDARDNRLIGDLRDNILFGKGGMDWGVGSGGADLFVLANGYGDADTNHLIVEDFRPREGDRILLQGMYVEDGADAHAHAYQVDDDVWLSRGASTRGGPQTLILQDFALSALRPDHIVARWGQSDQADNYDPVTRVEDVGGLAVAVGTSRNDTFDMNPAVFGGREIDELRGLDGDDYYSITDEKTRIVERDGEGLDTAIVWTRDYTLPSHVENIVVGSHFEASVTVRGNSADNVITAHHYNLRVAGDGGDDLIRLSSGRDVVHVGPGDGRDTIENFGGNDLLTLGAGYFADRQSVLNQLKQEGEDVALYLSADEAVRFRDARTGDFGAENFGFATSLVEDLSAHPGGTLTQGASPSPDLDVDAWGAWLL